MNSYEFYSFQNYCGDPVTVTLQSFNLIQKFCSENNVFVEDLFIHIMGGYGGEYNGDYETFILILSTEAQELKKLISKAYEIIDEYVDGDECDAEAIKREFELLNEERKPS